MEGTRHLLWSVHREQQCELILRVGYYTESITVYASACHMIHREGMFYHNAASLMIHVFQYIKGAYYAALYHLHSDMEMTRIIPGI